MMKTTSAPPAKAGISRTGMSKAYDSRRKELKLRMKKWMKICLMAAASAMLLAGCGTKDNTAETTAVETTAKAEDTKETETEKAEETTRAAASETAETTEAAEENSELDLAAAAGKHHVEITVKDYGTINVELDGDAAPITVANFLDLAGNGFYDGLTFHRIISGFMIQGGDPLGTGMGGSEREIKGEFDSNGTFLDGEYACFGYVTDGMDVVDAICEDTKVEDNNGTVAKENQPVIESIKVID